MSKVFTQDCCGPLGNGFQIYNGKDATYVGYATGCEDINGISEAISKLAKAHITVTVEEVQQAIYRHEQYHLPLNHPVHRLSHLHY